MDDLVQWLGEQLDEDERIAQAAPRGPWVVNDAGSITDADGGRVIPSVGGALDGRVSRWPEGPATDHVLGHDPARVLREIEAKRATIREYEKAIRSRNELVPNTSGYRHWDNRSFGLYVALRHMVAVYADRPGYAEVLAAEKAALLADE